ncbi:LysR family transcriptional regulator [Cognaticolwellia mytili]|uniref:LysR family transcriptional regulator n=1 Tax=Cognaticolwellia mytili TaxID=1888913 RepID=UPI000A173E4C|nr:LysR family transcriptional regulator [Cognaticolwellia mytili]
MQQYDLVALRSFIAVVDTGSFNQAAELLNASTAAVSRRVSGLEAALDVRLLNRTTRRVELTEAGQQFYQDVVNVFQSLDEAQERIQSRSQNLKGNLRISAPLSFGVTSLNLILTGFMKLHPELKIHLQLEDHRTDFVAEGIDVGIRIGRLENSTLVALPITNISAVFCAAPSYLKEYGEPKVPEDLLNHNCLRYSLTDPKLGWIVEENGVERSIDVSGTLTCNNGNALKEAAIEGLGVLYSPDFIIGDAIKNGQLIEVLSGYKSDGIGLYAIKLSRKFTSAKVIAFIDYLKAYYAEG